jgi:hypothetical protein
MPVKLHPILKTFIYEAYSRHLTAMQLQNTVGQQGYVQQDTVQHSGHEWW